jgi:hypothetical protein
MPIHLICTPKGPLKGLLQFQVVEPYIVFDPLTFVLDL